MFSFSTTMFAPQQKLKQNILQAIENKDAQSAKTFIQDNPKSLLVPDKAGNLPLHLALKYNLEEVVDKILSVAVTDPKIGNAMFVAKENIRPTSHFL